MYGYSRSNTTIDKVLDLFKAFLLLFPLSFFIFIFFKISVILTRLSVGLDFNLDF